MRAPSRPVLLALALLAGCGQKGALVLPGSRSSTPVVIRGPGSAPSPAATPPASPAPPAPPNKTGDDQPPPQI